jgi:hypothetical protein
MQVKQIINDLGEQRMKAWRCKMDPYEVWKLGLNEQKRRDAQARYQLGK